LGILKAFKNLKTLKYLTNKIKIMKNILLKYSCLITGDSYNIVSNESISSQQKIKTYGLIVLIISIVWGLNGFLLSKNFMMLDATQTMGLVSLFILFIIIFEMIIIRMSNVKGAISRLRIILAISSAIVGSIIMDEIIFKNDVASQIEINNQNELQNNNKLNTFKQLRYHATFNDSLLQSQILDVDKQMIEESRKVYPGPKTMFLKSELLSLQNQKRISEKKVDSLENLLQIETNRLLEKKDEQDGIMKSIIGLKDYLISHPWALIIYIPVTLFFFVIELFGIYYKKHEGKTSYESKKENNDVLIMSQDNNRLKTDLDPIRSGLRLIKSKI